MDFLKEVGTCPSTISHFHELWTTAGNHPVVRQPLRQWVLKITHFADRLEQDLAGIEWPEGTLVAQKQWIGRSVGAAVQFSTDLHGTLKEKWGE